MIVGSIFEVGLKDEEKSSWASVKLSHSTASELLSCGRPKVEFGVSSHQLKSNKQISLSGVSGLWAASPLECQPGPATYRHREKGGFQVTSDSPRRMHH